MKLAKRCLACASVSSLSTSTYKIDRYLQEVIDKCEASHLMIYVMAGSKVALHCTTQLWLSMKKGCSLTVELHRSVWLDTQLYIDRGVEVWCDP